MVAYIVKKGDTMYKISKKYDVPLQTLIRVNPHIPNPNLIYPGQLIYIPLKKDHKLYPREPKCMIPYLPQVLNMYYMSQMVNMQPMMNVPPGGYAPQLQQGPYMPPSYDYHYDSSIMDSNSDSMDSSSS